MSGHEFLCELLCEEIPANALPGARAQLAAAFEKELSAAGFSGFEVRAFSTVRRLVVSVRGLSEQQPDRDEEVLGPSVRAAFAADGAPMPAAVGFARGQGVALDALRVVKTPKGDVVAATRHLVGKPTVEVLAALCPRVVPALHFPKSMRWGGGEYTFVRPLHAIVALVGAGRLDTVVPFEIFGVRAGSATVGHRVIAPEAIELKGVLGFAAYQNRLRAAAVTVDHEERRGQLRERAELLASEVGCSLAVDEALLDELVELVESAWVVRGVIEERFLDLPEEVLVTTLRHHQKCLVLLHDGRVAPYFLAVCDRNQEPSEVVIRGNEWVAGARLADASFFFGQDRKRPLADGLPGLEKVMVHQKLGSFAAKTELVENLAVALAAGRAEPVDETQLRRTCRLLKCDLTTAMVGEFPELQGIVGGIYARLDGEDDAVWHAVYDQYRPAGLDGPIPRSELAALVGIADRLDTLAGMFAVGEIPSGSKDPFALRRAALAVVRICAEAPLAVDLGAAVAAALAGRVAGGTADSAVLSALRDFVQERERFYLTNVVGVAGEAADAVLAARWGVVPDDVARARALEAVRQGTAFADLAVAFKRVRNMVAKSGAGRPDPGRLTDPAELDLLAALGQHEEEVKAALGRGDVQVALGALAGLAAPLDRFFTDVLVLVDDEALRNARLGLLARVEELFLTLADVSKLSV